MTDIGSIRAFITADSSDFDQELDKAGRKSESFAKRATKNFRKVGKEMTALGKSMSIAVTAPILAAGAGLIKLASDAEETANKFNVVFSSITTEANAAAQGISDSFGLASDQSQKLLADTGDLLTGFGFSQQAALEMSTQVNTLAADLASFTNIEGGATRASAALTKALLGERESVKLLGISILDVDVKARVLTNQQKGLTFETVRQAKAFATLQLAQEQSKNAIGDFARSSSSFANQMRIATAQTRDLAVSFGKQLLPVAMIALNWVNDINKAFGELTPQTQRMVIVVAGLAAALGPLLFIGGKVITMTIGLITGIGAILPVVAAVSAALLILPNNLSFVADAFTSLGNFFGEFVAFIKDDTAALSDSTRTAIEFIAKVWLGLRQVWNAVLIGFKTVGQGLIRTMSAILTPFRAIADALGLDIAKGIGKAQDALAGWDSALELSKTNNFETIEEMRKQWGNAPNVLRNDINALVNTFKALPEGIAAQLSSAFPGATEAIRNLVEQVQGFINSGELPPITLPIVPTIGGDGGDAGGGFGASDMEGIGAEIAKFAAEQKEKTDAIRKLWMGVGRTYASVFGQISSTLKKGSAAQKAFAISSIIMDTAIGIMKAMELPYPLNWAQAAAVGALGIAQLAAVGGSGGGSEVSESSSGTFSDQTQVGAGAQQSQVIGAPETDLDATGNIPVFKLVLEGDDATAIVTRGALRGAGDGVNTLATVGA